MAENEGEETTMPKRPDYGDATPDDLAIALMRLQRPPLKKRPETEQEGDGRSTEQSDENNKENDDA